MKNSTQPSLFVSHGSPTFALEPPESSASAAYLNQFAARHDATHGVVVVSPHWQTRGQTVAIANGRATRHSA